jgi:hypothetical protein
MGSNYDNANQLHAGVAITNSAAPWDNCGRGGHEVVTGGAVGEYVGL